MKARQLPFDFGETVSFDPGDFLVAPANRDAVALLQSWPDWPANLLVLYGPPGAGKSHLARLWEEQAEARILVAAALRADMVPALSAQAVVLEDVDEGVDEIALFHLINLGREQGGYLLLTAQSAPSRWRLRLPDLQSRLNAAPSVGLSLPDDALLGAVLVKLFADRQLRVDAPVIAYLLGRIDRSFVEARAVVAALDDAALAERREITVRLARAVLEGGQNP